LQLQLRKRQTTKLRAIFLDTSIFLIGIPLFLTIVFFSDLNDKFVLYLNDPSLFTIYFSNFAHSNLNHFFDNTVAYIVIIFLILLLRTDRKEFYYDIFLIFFIVPFVVSISTLLLINAHTSLGFSGIVSAIMAYYLFSVYEFTQKQLNVCLSYAVVILIFGFSFLLVLLQYSLANLIEFRFLIFVGIVLSLLLPKATKDIIKAYKSMKQLGSTERGKFTVIIISIFMFFSYSLAIMMFFVLFPIEIATSTGQVNIFGHLIGYCCGLILPISQRIVKNSCKYEI